MKASLGQHRLVLRERGGHINVLVLRLIVMNQVSIVDIPTRGRFKIGACLRAPENTECCVPLRRLWGCFDCAPVRSSTADGRQSNRSVPAGRGRGPGG